jgi:hypothetical protein
MAFSDHLELFLVVLVGAVLAIGVTLLILRKKGLISYGQPADDGTPLNEGLIADPRLEALSAEDRRKVVANVRWHPIVLLWLFSTLIGFVWVGTGSNVLADFVNSAPRGAALIIAAIVLPIIFIGLKLLYRWLIGRAIRRLTPR